MPRIVHRIVLPLILALAVLAPAEPVAASYECAPYITSGWNDEPVMGELIGQRLVTIRVGGGGFGYTGDISESFYVGTYRFMGHFEWVDDINCSNYQAYTLLP